MSLCNFRNAHTSYCIGDVYQVPDQSHCPKIAILRAMGVNQSVDDTSAMTFAIGLANEKLFEKDYPNVNRDVTCELAIDEKYGILGHADGVDNATDTVYELKSITSTKSAKSVLIDKQYKLGNLLQLIGYMIMLKRQNGILRYTNYVWHSSTTWKVKPTHVEFKVNFNEDGLVKVDNKPTDITAKSVVDSWHLLAKSVELDTIATCVAIQPSVCMFCRLKPVCNTTKCLSELAKIAVEEYGFIKEENGNEKVETLHQKR